MEFLDAQNNPLAQEASYVVHRMKQMGVLMSTDGPDRNVIKIKPPMVISIAQANRVINSLEQVLREDFIKKQL